MFQFGDVVCILYMWSLCNALIPNSENSLLVRTLGVSEVRVAVGFWFEGVVRDPVSGDNCGSCGSLQCSHPESENSFLVKASAMRYYVLRCV